MKKKEIDLSDGVDYIRHQFHSEKGAPLADYEPVDGSIRMCMDEMWDQVKETSFCLAEENLIALYCDTLSHELCHKWFVWGMDDEFTETWNEMDERVMRVMSDWTERGSMTKMAEYDYK